MTEEQNPREIRRRNVPRDLRQYYLGLLKPGARWNVIEDAEAGELLPRHLEFLRAQIEAKNYLFAGPVQDDGPFVGMMILQASSKEAAVALVAEDPGVKAGRLAFEIHPVYLPSLDMVKVQY